MDSPGQSWCTIGRDRLTELEAVLVAQSPTESCGLAAGNLPACWVMDLPAAGVADRGPPVWPCLNVWKACLLSAQTLCGWIPESSCCHRNGDPRTAGSCIGTAHSHSAFGEALPSELGTGPCFPPALMLNRLRPLVAQAPAGPEGQRTQPTQRRFPGLVAEWSLPSQLQGGLRPTPSTGDSKIWRIMGHSRDSAAHAPALWAHASSITSGVQALPR